MKTNICFISYFIGCFIAANIKGAKICLYTFYNNWEVTHLFIFNKKHLDKCGSGLNNIYVFYVWTTKS